MLRRSLIVALYACGAVVCLRGVDKALQFDVSRFAPFALAALVTTILAGMAVRRIGPTAFPVAAALLGGTMAVHPFLSGAALYAYYGCFAPMYAFSAAGCRLVRERFGWKPFLQLAGLYFGTGLAALASVDLLSTTNQIVLGVCGIALAEVMRLKPETARPPKP